MSGGELCCWWLTESAGSQRGPGPVLRRSVGWGRVAGVAVPMENQADPQCGLVSSEGGLVMVQLSLETGWTGTPDGKSRSRVQAWGLGARAKQDSER